MSKQILSDAVSVQLSLDETFESSKNKKNDIALWIQERNAKIQERFVI
jgi:hypothetical protein